MCKIESLNFVVITFIEKIEWIKKKDWVTREPPRDIGVMPPPPGGIMRYARARMLTLEFYSRVAGNAREIINRKIFNSQKKKKMTWNLDKKYELLIRKSREQQIGGGGVNFRVYRSLRASGLIHANPADKSPCELRRAARRRRRWGEERGKWPLSDEERLKSRSAFGIYLICICSFKPAHTYIHVPLQHFFVVVVIIIILANTTRLTNNNKLLFCETCLKHFVIFLDNDECACVCVKNNNENFGKMINFFRFFYCFSDDNRIRAITARRFFLCFFLVVAHLRQSIKKTQ